MVSSSFTGWNNYMMDFGKLVGDPEAMKTLRQHRGRVDLHACKPRKVLDVPGSPLEVRCAWPPNDEARFVRNIYSLSFLDPELLGNDIATLGLDRDQDAAGARRGGSE